VASFKGMRNANEKKPTSGRDQGSARENETREAEAREPESTEDGVTEEESRLVEEFPDGGESAGKKY